MHVYVCVCVCVCVQVMRDRAYVNLILYPKP